MNWYCEQKEHHNFAIVSACTIVHMGLYVSAVSYVADVPMSIFDT